MKHFRHRGKKIMVNTIFPILILPQWVSLIWYAWNWKYFGFGVFVFWKMYIPIMSIFRTGCKSKHEIHLCFTCTLHSLKVILYTVFSAPVFYLQPVAWDQVWNFPLKVSVGTQNILDFGAFQISGLRMFNLYSLFLFLLCHLSSHLSNPLLKSPSYLI